MYGNRTPQFAIMNIWEAYCNPAFYNIYFDILVAKGVKRENAERLKTQYTNYIQRIKGTRYAAELKQCSDKQQFLNIIHLLFDEKWKNHLRYIEMPAHYDNYMLFLDSMQALHDDFINDAEKQRLISRDPEIPVPNLTHYELDFLKDGKLVALMNPQLLYLLKQRIEGDGLKPSKASLLCETFYGDLLPQMSIPDYSQLLETLWNPSHKVKKGGKHKQFRIKTPDGIETICTTTNGLKYLIAFYGESAVARCKLKIRNNDFIINRLPAGKEKSYEKISETTFMCLEGNTTDRLRLFNAINMMLGKKLTIELI